MNKFKVNISEMTCTGCRKHVESTQKDGLKNIESLVIVIGETVFELSDKYWGWKCNKAILTHNIIQVTEEMVQSRL